MRAIFDLDGTLIDSVWICTDIMNAMLADRGSARRVSAVDTRRHISVGGARMIEALFCTDCGNPADEINEFRQRYRTMPTPPNSLFPGVAEGLRALQAQGVQLAICSNKPQALCEKVLADCGIAPFFDAVVGSQGGIPAKPDPALTRHVLSCLSGEERACCYVGDAEPDYLLAKRSGLPFILVTYGYADPDFAMSADVRCDNFADVAPAVMAVLGDGVERAVG